MLAGKGAGSLRVPLPRRPQGQGADDSAGGGTSAFALSLPKVLAIPRTKKKRKLVISGIGMGDDARVEGVRKWCESFGEVSQMVRVPNGDLHVDFKKSEVADTVCRLHARVFIVGVGSVCLSWYKGKKP